MTEGVKKMKDYPTGKCDSCGADIYGWRMSHYKIRQTDQVICAGCGGDDPLPPKKLKPEPEAL